MAAIVSVLRGRKRAKVEEKAVDKIVTDLDRLKVEAMSELDEIDYIHGVMERPKPKAPMSSTFHDALIRDAQRQIQPSRRKRSAARRARVNGTIIALSPAGQDFVQEAGVQDAVERLIHHPPKKRNGPLRSTFSDTFYSVCEGCNREYHDSEMHGHVRTDEGHFVRKKSRQADYERFVQRNNAGDVIFDTGGRHAAILHTPHAISPEQIEALVAEYKSEIKRVTHETDELKRQTKIARDQLAETTARLTAPKIPARTVRV